MLLGKRADDLQNLPGQLGVERRGRLIKAENIRLQGQRPRDGHTLLLTAGKLMRIEIHLFLQPDLRQKFLCTGGNLCVDLFFSRFVIRLLLCQQFACQHDILPGRILREQVEILEHEAEVQPLAADFALLLRIGVGVVEERFIVHHDLSLVGNGQKIEAPQQRRFAAAGRADNGDRLALFERKIDALQDDGILVEAFFQVSDFQNRHTAASLRLEIVQLLLQPVKQQLQNAGEQQIINASEEQGPDCAGNALRAL